MEKKNRKKLVAASVAGLLAVAGAMITGTSAFAEGVACYGVNACKGQGACGGKNNSCAGKNACKGQGFINVDNNEACSTLKGTLTPAV